MLNASNEEATRESCLPDRTGNFCFLFYIENYEDGFRLTDTIYLLADKNLLDLHFKFYVLDFLRNLPIVFLPFGNFSCSTAAVV